MKKKTIVGADGKEYVLKLKKPFYKKWWFWLLILIVVGALASDEEENVHTASQTTESDVVEEVEEEITVVEETEEKSAFNIGEVITTDNFEFTITSREISDEVEDDSGYITKTADGTYLILNIDYKNIANEAKRIDNSSFTLIIDGAEYSPTDEFVFIRDDSIFNDTINPGIAKSGKIFFDVPKDIANRTELLLVLSDSFLSDSGAAQINLK